MRKEKHLAKYLTSELAQKIDAYLAVNLSRKRYKHIKRVCYFAVILAKREENSHQFVEAAFLAALLHDSTKELNHNQQLAILKKTKAPTDYNLLPKPIVHAKTAAYFAQDEFAVNDPAVLAAISNHTTGRLGMPLLSRIIFAADYLGSLDKKKAKKELKRSLKKICLNKVTQTITYLFSKKHTVHYDTVALYNGLVQSWL